MARREIERRDPLFVGGIQNVTRFFKKDGGCSENWMSILNVTGYKHPALVDSFPLPIHLVPWSFLQISQNSRMEIKEKVTFKDLLRVYARDLKSVCK